MTNVETTTKAPRESVAKHEYVGSDGAVVESMDDATGIKYTDKASGETFVFQIPDGKGRLLLAIFGAKTKATNETSRVRNGKGGTTKEEFEALDEVFEKIANGGWPERAEGGGGSRTDKALLADCLIEALGENAKGDQAHYVSRFESDMEYMRKVLKSAAGEEYRKRAGKTGPAVDTLA